MKRFAWLFILLMPMPADTPAFIQVLVKDQPFVIEVADTLEKQERGLMYRDCLPPERGMLFVYGEEDFRTFWMKNTRITLDLLFLNRERQVVDLIPRVPPCLQDPCATYTSAVPAQYVLEIAGGRAQELKLQIGDFVFFTLPTN